MRTGDLIKSFRKEKGFTQKQLADKVNLTSQVISNIERNYTSVSAEDLLNIAHALDVTPNQLLGNEIQDKSYHSVSEKEINDIAIQAEKLLEGIENGSDLNFYGEPATNEQKERIRVALKTAMEMNKEEAKKKFTPKKYRN